MEEKEEEEDGYGDGHGDDKPKWKANRRTSTHTPAEK